MAVGRKSPPQEQPFGGEVIGVASAALAVFLVLAFSSYHPGDAPANLAGPAGYLTADWLCPPLGKACYLIPAALLYNAGVLWHLLRCPAPFSQTVAFVVFALSTAAFLGLWCENRPVTEAGGWVGGFLALHFQEWLNRLGAYVALSPLLL